MEAATWTGYSESLILSGVVYTAIAHNLIANASLAGVVTEHVPGATGVGVETSSPKRRPTGCVVIHVPVGREALECTEADRLAQRLASLLTRWWVVVTSPERLDATDLERVTGRRPSQEDTQGDSVYEEGDVSFRLVRDLDPRGMIAFPTQCDDLWDPGHVTGGNEGGDSGPLVLRIIVGSPPVPGTRADNVTHRQVFDYLLNSPGYMADLIGLFARRPDLSVAIPAAGHIGQAHEGPTWDGLAGTVRALSRRFGLSVELNPFVPVAPPDTIFTTRPGTLHTLGEGAKELVRLTDQTAAGAEQSAERLRRTRAVGVLELLTVYAVMSSGFHPHEVLTPVWVGWLYETLAYKHRVVTVDLPAHTSEQVKFLQARFKPLAGVGVRVRTYVDVHYPDMGSALKPTYRYPTGGASGLTRAATNAGRCLRSVGRHREEDKED